MFKFSAMAWSFLAVVFMVCLIVLVMIVKKTRRHVSSKENNHYRKYSIIYVSAGILLIVLSLVSFIRLSADDLQNFWILQTISEMTSEPIRAVTLAGMLIGITLVMIGICYKMALKSLRGK